MRAYEACLIKCHITNQQWCYTKKSSYAEDALVPVDAPIYQVKELDELILLAHSEPVERNGLMLLFVQKGTMELINPVEIESYSGNIKRILVAEETAKIALGLIAKEKRNA